MPILLMQYNAQVAWYLHPIINIRWQKQIMYVACKQLNKFQVKVSIVIGYSQFYTFGDTLW